jgi:hypothetical protein
MNYVPWCKNVKIPCNFFMINILSSIEYYLYNLKGLNRTVNGLE